jgi:hypothetical protein
VTKTAKIELFLIETDKDGNETRHKVKLRNFKDNIDNAKWWVDKCISRQEYEDSQPEAGMGSGCW